MSANLAEELLDLDELETGIYEKELGKSFPYINASFNELVSLNCQSNLTTYYSNNESEENENDE